MICVVRGMGHERPVEYGQFQRVQSRSARHSLELYKIPAREKLTTTALPLITTPKPSKHKKFLQRRRKKKKQTRKVRKPKVNSLKEKSNQKNRLKEGSKIQPLRAVELGEQIGANGEGPKNTSTRQVGSARKDIHHDSTSDGRDVIGLIAQQVSDTFSIKKHLKKYKSIAEERQQRQKKGKQISEPSIQARSYQRPSMVSRAIQGTPTTTRPKQYSNALSSHSLEYPFQSHPNSYSFFNLGPDTKLETMYHPHSQSQRTSVNSVFPQSANHKPKSGQPAKPTFRQTIPPPTLRPVTTFLTSPSPSIQQETPFVPLRIGARPLTSTTFLPTPPSRFPPITPNPLKERPTFVPTNSSKPPTRKPNTVSPKIKIPKREEKKEQNKVPTLSVISPSILKESSEEKDFFPVKKGRNSFAARESDFQKLALDDQQTLALNELLLQVTEMKTKMANLEMDNKYLRTQV